MTTDFDFRAARADEMDAFQALGRYVFAEPPSDDEPDNMIAPEWTHCAFDGDTLAASSGAFPFIVRLNGKTAPIAGVTAVGTEPGYRRRGLVRRLITDLLHRAKEEGQVGSILLASMGAIYQRFGYGLACADVRYEFDPRLAQFQQPMPTGGVTRRLSKDDALPHIKACFKEYVRDRNLMALRADVVWDRLLDGADKAKTFCAVHFGEDDTPEAWCIYSTRWYDRPDPGPDQELTIRDFGWRNLNGYRAMWEYVCAHDLVGKVIWGQVPQDDPAPGLLLEPRCLKQQVMDCLWFRPVDVPALLAARRYDRDGEVVIQCAGDNLCEWNNGTWALRVSGGESTVEPAPSAEPDLTVNPNALGPLVCGYQTASWLGRIGRLGVDHPEKLPEIDALFATRYRPAISFGF